MIANRGSMNKNRMIREIGRRCTRDSTSTHLKNRDVQLMLETLIDVWTEELVAGGRIELENFLVGDTDHRPGRTARDAHQRRSTPHHSEGNFEGEQEAEGDVE